MRNALNVSSPPGKLTLRADISEMQRASEWLEGHCRQQGVPPDQVGRLLLCLDEAFANVLDHGGPTALAQPIQLLFEMSVDGKSRTASVTLSDAGPAFDPVSAPAKDLPKTLEEAVPRGRGLQMIRAVAPVFRYRREDAHNHMTFGTCWQHE